MKEIKEPFGHITKPGGPMMPYPSVWTNSFYSWYEIWTTSCARLQMYRNHNRKWEKQS